MEQLSQRHDSQKLSQKHQVCSEVIVWNRDRFVLSNNLKKEKVFSIDSKSKKGCSEIA